MILSNTLHRTWRFLFWLEQTVVGALLIAPVFFQLHGEIFSAKTMVYNSNGRLADLPLPFSIIACFAGILLMGKVARIKAPAAIIFFSIAIMALGATFSALIAGEKVETGKLILLAQFALPMFALILGASWTDPSPEERKAPTFEMTALLVLSLLIPLQLYATFDQGKYPLAPWLYKFSVYQHLQYVPVIITGVFWWICIVLYEHPWPRRLALTLVPVVSFYAVTSMSIQAVGACVIGGSALAVLRGFNWRTLSAVVLMVAGLAGAFQYDRLRPDPPPTEVRAATIETMHWDDKLGGAIESKNDAPAPPENQGLPAPPSSLVERTKIWQIYWSELTKSADGFFFGSPTVMDRRTFPSAHNYFLDLAFNFGVLSLAPLVVLMSITSLRFLKRLRNRQLSPGVLALGGLVLFLVVVNNSLTVALRQPYPGILTFFLWGLLLKRCEDKEKSGGHS